MVFDDLGRGCCCQGMGCGMKDRQHCILKRLIPFQVFDLEANFLGMIPVNMAPVGLEIFVVCKMIGYSLGFSQVFSAKHVLEDP